MYFYFVFHAAVYFSRVSHDGFYVNYCAGGVWPWSPWYIRVSRCCSPDTTSSTNTTGLSISHITTQYPVLPTAHLKTANTEIIQFLGLFQQEIYSQSIQT